MSLIRNTFGILVALALLAACSASTEPTEPDATRDVRPDTVEDAAVDTTDIAPDTPDARVDVVSMCPPAAGGFSSPCMTDSDCTRGICLADGDGGICTDFCFDTCPSFCDGRRTFCRGVESGDGVAFVCAPEQDASCQPCQDAVQCGAGACLTFPDGTRACGRECTRDSDCRDDFVCGTFEGSEGQCVPASGTCSCTEANAGLQRPCDNTNGAGSCLGAQTCEPSAGWTACDAIEPTGERCNGIDDNCDGLIDNGAEIGPECTIDNEIGSCVGVAICGGDSGYTCFGEQASDDVCDGIDNDCDGVVDQDYVDPEGRYATLEHCGECGLDCSRRIAFATATRCSVADGAARCVVTECEAGYRVRGDSACVPLIPNLCQPCASALDCEISSPGALCVEVIDASDSSRTAKVCGRDCSAESPFGVDCPDGYFCDESISDGPAQCVPSSGSCSCLDAPDGFNVPCTVETRGEIDLEGTLGDITCGGLRFCDGTRLGACELPYDECNGFDDDCSGSIDDDFRDERGLYASDEHCGRCNNDCADVFTPDVHNATGRCADAGLGTACEMVCEPGFHDLVNGSDDGCECEELAGDDLPARFGAGCDGPCDSNCDGIDGDVGVALFVSKTGTDVADAGSRENPLASIGLALERGHECARGTADGYCPPEGFRDIYVASGVYSENLSLWAGVNLYGGYSLDFAVRDIGANPTTVYGVARTGDERATITAEVITRATIFSGFTVYGYPATEPGESAYTVHLTDSTDAFRLEDNVFVAANGADGESGVRGISGSGGSNGGNGGLGRAGTTIACGVGPTAGGSAGASVCGAAGGAGGSANCPTARTSGGAQCSTAQPDRCLNTCVLPTDDCTPLPPAQGLGGTGAANGGCTGADCGAGGDPAYDFWSDTGSCGQCGNQVGLPHNGGLGANGRSGADGGGGGGCTELPGLVDSTGRWVGGRGDDGVDSAQSGGGGGGGSAGAGFDIVPGSSGDGCHDNLGGSGGGGGGGGCAGTPGTGGGAGGASFAVFIFTTPGYTGGSAPVLDGNTIVQARGGSGGAGGAGGAGGLGGFGGAGGFTYPNQAFCTSPGGNGGDGGSGGAGAAGGGGCGGNSYGVFLYAPGQEFAAEAGTDWEAANSAVPSGDGGRGGSGGASTGASGAQGSAGSRGIVESIHVR